MGAIRAPWLDDCTAPQQRRDGDNGLAGADVALQQAVHRAWRGEIGVDLADDSTLGGRQVVRQRGVEALHELAGDLVREADRVRLDLPLAPYEHELDAQQLVERQSPTGLVLGVDRLGQVDRPERRSSVDERQPRPDVVTQRVGDTAWLAAVEGALDPPGELPRGELDLLALRVDRNDAPGAVADQVDDRVRHLQAVAVQVDGAEQSDVEPFDELALAPRLVEEHDVQSPGAVTDHRLDDRAPVARRAPVSRADGDQDEGLGARHEVGDASFVGAVDPPPRIAHQQIEDGLDAERLERVTLALADAAQLADVVAVELAERDPGCAHSTPTRYGYSGWPPVWTSNSTSGKRSAIHARQLGSDLGVGVTAGDQRDQLPRIIHEVLEQRLGGGGDVATDGDDAVTAHDAQPVARSDVAGRRLRGPYGLGHLSGEHGLGGPAHRQHVGRGVDLGVVGHQRGEPLGHRPGRHDTHGLGGERVDLFGDGDDVLVAREQDDLAGVGLLDGGEQLGRRRVEGLAPGDDDLHAEVAEQRADARATADGDGRAGHGRQVDPGHRCRPRPSKRRDRLRGWRARRRPPRTGR